MSELKVDKIFPLNGLPAGANGGGIIQIVMAEDTASNQTPDSASNTGWTDRTPTATITPQSASNKILIIGSVGCISGNNNHTRIQLLRGSTAIRIFGYYSTSAYSPLHFGGWHLDSPATTSAVTYKYQTAAGSNAGQFMWNYQGPSGTEPLRQAQMYLVEVAA